MSHTPGPWTWMQSPRNEWDGEDTYFEELRAADKSIVIDGQWWNTGDAGVSVSSVADANLIAAAPDMYAGLKDFLEAVGELEMPPGSVMFDHFYETIRNAKAALAKAEGK